MSKDSEHEFGSDSFSFVEPVWFGRLCLFLIFQVDLLIVDALLIGVGDDGFVRVNVASFHIAKDNYIGLIVSLQISQICTTKNK